MSSIKIKAKLIGPAGTAEHEVAIHHAIIAGWTGRDPAAVQKHIKELADLGVHRLVVAPPTSNPDRIRQAIEELAEKVAPVATDRPPPHPRTPPTHPG